MSSSEKQVEQLLLNANQALNFLRNVLDDLIFKRNDFKPNSQKRILLSQEIYKKNKAVIHNIENLIKKKEYPLPHKLVQHLIRNLHKRISVIIEEAIELDKLR